MLKNPIIRNLLVTLGVAAVLVLLGLAAVYGGQLVNLILKNGRSTLFIIAIVALVSAIVFGAIEMFESKNKRKRRSEDWQSTNLRVLRELERPNGKAKANPSGLFLFLYGNNKKSLAKILTL